MPKRKPDSPVGDLFAPAGATPVPPAFTTLLTNPIVTPLPDQFDSVDEAAHLLRLWSLYPKLQAYRFDRFVSAGGSGMVFKVFGAGATSARALKIARHKLFTIDRTEVATNLSPVSEMELRTLERLSHPNVVRLYDVIDDPQRGVVGIATTYVDEPQNIDQYLLRTLDKDPDPHKKRGVQPFSLQRLDDACGFLVDRCAELAGALQHLHRQGIYHFDVKPANVLVSETSKTATLTDMGACVHEEHVRSGKGGRVHFTWTYAHPDLQDLINQPAGISGGGLKASAELKPNEALPPYDLYALGKTLQELLAILDHEFEELCYASYKFRFLHLLSCLLLDGRNTPVERRTYDRDGHRFVDDIALGYPRDFFAANKLTSIDSVLARLERFRHETAWNADARELDPWQPDVINTSRKISAPFTKRVSTTVNHPAMARLKRQPQLGWMTEVYPGATHTRWAHSLGVASHLASAYSALLADPEVPTFRVLTDPVDVDHALLAGLIHDLGQSTFGHDFEVACPTAFKHEHFIERLLDDKNFDTTTLRELVAKHWPDVNVKRVLGILGLPTYASNVANVDGVARDLINGPIDADKLDYVQRDAMYCGVPYGDGVDTVRLMRALTVSARRDGSVSLAYKAKGRAAVEALLIARYQMYGAVYWHHTYRCIQAMFSHAAIDTFAVFETKGAKVRGTYLSKSNLQDLFYHRVIAGRPWKSLKQCGYSGPILDDLAGRVTPPRNVQIEPALDFVWRCGTDESRELVSRLASRRLYKRTFELRLGELDEVEYSSMSAGFTGKARMTKASKLQTLLMDSVDTIMRQRRSAGDTTTNAETAAQARMRELRQAIVPLVVLDFPVRGIADEANIPREIGDAFRKYFTLPRYEKPTDANVFRAIRRLQVNSAALRVFAAPDLHEMIIRYLNPKDIRNIIAEIVPEVKKEE